MRASRFLLLVAAVAACDRKADYDMSRLSSDSSRYTTESSGEVTLAEGGSLRFTVTSDVFRKWDAAQRGIDKSVQARFGDILKPEAPSERTIDAAVAFLEGQPTARVAIEQAGLSVREFVVTTVALEQEMRASTGQGSRQPDPIPVDTAFPPFPPDSLSYQPPPVTPYVPYQPPVYPPIDTFRRRVDTVFVDSTTRSRTPYSPWDSISRRRDSSVRTDTAITRVRDSIVSSIIRRDSIRRDSIRRNPPPPRDTIRRDTLVRRDTTRPPPDTLR